MPYIISTPINATSKKCKNFTLVGQKFFYIKAAKAVTQICCGTSHILMTTGHALIFMLKYNCNQSGKGDFISE